MAEYNMTYNDLKRFIDRCIEISENKMNLSKYKAEILAALTLNEISDNSMETSDAISLWENQLGTPSELLLGTRYIRIKDSMIAFVEAACCSGLIDALLSVDPVTGLTVSVIAGVMMSLRNLFTTVSDLDDQDFCVYMQAVTHFKTHKFFTKEELLEWFPHDMNLICNMHNSKWDCDFLESDRCSIIVKGGIEKALESLDKKSLLICEHKDKTDYYKFPW